MTKRTKSDLLHGQTQTYTICRWRLGISHWLICSAWATGILSFAVVSFTCCISLFFIFLLSLSTTFWKQAAHFVTCTNEHIHITYSDIFIVLFINTCFGTLCQYILDNMLMSGLTKNTNTVDCFVYMCFTCVVTRTRVSKNRQALDSSWHRLTNRWQT